MIIRKVWRYLAFLEHPSSGTLKAKNKLKGHKQYSQNGLRSSMSEGEEL